MSIEEPLADFFERYTTAWNTFHAEPVLACLGFPHLVATAESTHFFEDEDEARAHIETLLARYRDAGVAAIEQLALSTKPLPDDAARATIAWRLTDERGGEVIQFTTLYTLAAEAGEWLIVAIDAQAEVDAWEARARR